MREAPDTSEAPDSITAAWLSRARATDYPEGYLIADMRSELRRGADVPTLFPNMASMRHYRKPTLFL